METKLERIAEISANSPRPEFTSLYHLINKEMLLQCHKELDGNKAVGVDEITKKEYERNLEQNIDDLVERLKRKSYKPQPSIRVYIPKSNGKLRPLGIACYEDKIVQLALKKILEAIYEPRFLNCMYGFRPNRGCHNAIKELYKRLNNTKICYIVDADIKGFFDHMKHEWIIKFLKLYIKDPNIIGLVKKYLKVGVLDNGELMVNEEGSAQGNIISPILANIYMHNVLTLQKTAPVHVPPAQPIITPAVPPAVPQPPQQQTQESPKEEMSLLHLLTHYSKENKALYDQQKAAQKGKPKQAVSKPSKPAKTERHANQSAKSQSFAVPGVEQRGSAPSFAIPGQSAPAVQPVIQTPPQPKPQIPVTPVVQQPVAVQPVQIPVQPPVQTIPMVQTGEKMDFGNTTILNGGGRVGETTVLNNASQQSRRIAPYLIRSRNHEEIAVNKPQFRIGKERSYVDYFIGDNPAISRSHATIITRENTYFIVDTNSTNHTYVDGKMIQPNTEVPIQQGTKIRLGNEDFEFKLR